MTQAVAVNGARPVDAVEAAIRHAVEALDFEAVAAEFRDQGKFLFLPQFLPAALVARMVAEARALLPQQHRTFLPFLRKAGTVGQADIARRAPLLHAAHQSPALLELASRLAGIDLEFKSEGDAHAAALYCYERAGDHVAFHYDHCGCEGTASYTATLGLVNDSTATLHVQLHKDDPTRAMRELHLPSTPGSLVLFCGSKIHHRVTPLGRGERRITYSFAYVKGGKLLTGLPRLVENVKDAILYFGPKAIFQKNYR